MSRPLAAVALAFFTGCGNTAPGGSTDSVPRADETLAAGQVPVTGGWDVFPSGSGVSSLPPVPRLLHVPEVVASRLEIGHMPCPGMNGALCDHYVLQLTAGQPVTILARGGANPASPGSSLDMMLFLYRDRVQIAMNDDGAANGGALNSRIVFTPATTGTYILRVTTYGGSLSQGDYQVQTYEGALDLQL